MAEQLHEQIHPGTAASSKTQRLLETLWTREPLPGGTPPARAIVVTISRQFGSGGSDIARMVADRGNLHYVDSRIIDEVADRLGIDAQYAANQNEQTIGLTGHILEAMQSSSPFTVNYHQLLNPDLSLSQSREAAYLHFTQKVILELATEGNAVIVGRGSQFLLHNAPRTLHIYIFSPLPYRIENVMREYQLDHQQAQHLIEQRDYEQDSYQRRYYGTDGQQASLYHLLINTGLFSFELATELIHQAIPVIKAMS